jgi:hypothetical protein
MSMKLVTEFLTRPVFTYVQDDGVNINLDVTNLRAWCLTHFDQSHGPKLVRIPVEEHIARHFINDNIASIERVTELSRRHLALLDPVILCRNGFNTDGTQRDMYVDGHHRYVLAYMNRMKHLPGFFLEPAQWSPFSIDGLPAMTQKELKDLPIAKRNY